MDDVIQGLEGSQSQEQRQQQDVKPSIKYLQRHMSSVSDAEYIPDDDEEREPYDVEPDDNLSDDVIVPYPSKMVKFYVFGSDDVVVLTTTGSEYAPEFVQALATILQDKEITTDTIYSLRGSLKSTIGKKIGGQIWSKGYVYFYGIDLLVPVSFFFGGSGREAKTNKDIVRSILLSYKDKISAQYSNLKASEKENPQIFLYLVRRIVDGKFAKKIEHVSGEELLKIWQEIA